MFNPLRPLCVFLSIFGFLCLANPLPALAGHDGEKPDKTGILLTAFGTSVKEAETALNNIDRLVKQAHPGIEVRWAYTSKIIRDKLASEEKRMIDSPAEGLAKMMEDGFTHVAVQSLHSIPGEEYESLLETVRRFDGMPKGFKKITLGAPLLSTHQDMEKAALAITAMPPKERKKNEAVVLMGHGTHHPANIYYPGLQNYLLGMDPLFLVGTVEGAPSLDDVLAKLKQNKTTKAYLIPFMSVAGDHARNDMAGDEDDSWKSVLTKAGITCVPLLKGTAEYQAFADIWLEHLEAALARL